MTNEIKDPRALKLRFQVGGFKTRIGQIGVIALLLMLTMVQRSVAQDTPCTAPGCDPVPTATVCEDGTESITLECDAGLTDIVWYNGNGDQVGTGCNLVIDNSLVGTGVEGQTMCFYYEGLDSNGCPGATCCPVIVTVNSCQAPPPCQSPGCDPVPRATVCSNGTEPITLECDAGLTDIVWYNGNGDQVGTGCSLVIDNSLVGTGAIGQTMCFYYEGLDSNGCPGATCCPVIIEVVDCGFYDLAIDKSISSTGTYYPGSTVTYEVVVENQGTLDASNIQVIDVPQSGLVYVTSNAGSDLNLTELSALNYEIASLPAGQLETIELTFTIDQNFTGMILLNNVNISGDDGDDIDSDPLTIEGVEVDDEDEVEIEIEQFAGLGDRVWKDLNGDGIQNNNEPGVENVGVLLYKCLSNGTDSLVALDFTDSAGEYYFDNLIPDEYKVIFDYSNLTADCKWTTQNQGDSSNDSDVDDFGRTVCTTLEGGEQDSSWDAGLVPYASLGDFVWIDLNGNGIQDPAEPGIEDVWVNLYDSDGNFIATTSTDADGYYVFEQLDAGEYFLEFDSPNGYDLTLPFQGSNTAEDSDVDGSNGPGTTPIFDLDWGEHDPTWDVGFHTCIPIGEYVWYDANTNDIFDNGENGINGIEVILWRQLVSGEWIKWDQENTGLNPAQASGDGYYKFCAPPGTYYLEFVTPPTGIVPAFPGSGGPNEDSDITGANGPNTTDEFTVVTGDIRCDLGAGYHPMASVGQVVWFDDNADGIRSSGESPVQGVLVEAYDIYNDMVGSDVTNTNGNYKIDYLRREGYYLKFTPPAGYVITTPDATSNDAIDSDVNHSNGDNTTSFYSMEPGVFMPNVDAGLVVGAALPIELLSFTGQYRPDFVYLAWATKSEINTEFFKVERRHESEDQFVSIGRQVAKGGDSKYNLNDYDVQKDGIYYYRLRSIDSDGSEQLSEIISVTISRDREDGISIYPNPAVSDVNVEIQLGSDKEVQVDIYNTTGQLIKGSLIEGQMQAGTMNKVIDVSDIPAGVYNVKIYLGEDLYTRRLILLKN